MIEVQIDQLRGRALPAAPEISTEGVPASSGNLAGLSPGAGNRGPERRNLDPCQHVQCGGSDARPPGALV